MKTTNLTLVIFVLLITACQGVKEPADDFIIVDVTRNYPEKELILQDFMDVEYIPLETSDEFLTQGFVQDIGKNIILVRNRNRDGDIFVFDRKGKGLKKINRLGQGGEEYIFVLGITLDEENNEMFVNDHVARKIIVYDLDGNYKRSLKHEEGAMYNKIYNFDKEHLICHDGFVSDGGEANWQSLILISKLDGSPAKEINIPFNEKKLTDLILQDKVNNMTWGAKPSTDYSIVPYSDHWILMEPSSDTIYTYSQDHMMTPLIVRSPSIQITNPEVFLFVSIITNRYYFMETVKMVYDFEKDSGFPGVDLMYDKKERGIFRYTVYNRDYSNKKTVFMKSTPGNHEIATWQSLQSHDLVEAYKNGELRGELKEIAAKLDEESNPVILLLKQKR